MAYLQSVMSFDKDDYSMYSGCITLLAFVSLFPMVIFSKRLGLSEPILIAGGSAFFVAKFAFLTLTEFYKIFFYVRK